MKKYSCVSVWIGLVALVAASHAFATSVVGTLDRVNAARVASGWAFSTAVPALPIWVSMYIDGNFVQNVKTTVYRGDVNAIYGITGNHGYSWAIPSIYNDNNSHTLRVYGIAPDGSGNPELVGSPIAFANNQPIGMMEGVHVTNTFVSGWAFDPDQPNLSIDVRIYMDNPLGQGGRYVGSTNANIYRPDVNATYANMNVTGNHGFNWIIPPQYTNAYHVFYVYAVDSYNMAGIGNGANPQLVNSPMPYGTKPNGNASISSVVGGKQLVLTTANWAAGAITSLKWGDTEFVDIADHGRELQSAISFYQNFQTTEKFNPTEAGSGYDGPAGFPSTSVLQAISTDPSVPSLDTQTQMAYWNFGVFCDVCNYSTPVSEIVLSKHVVLGYNGFDNVIAKTVTFDVPTPNEYPYGYSEYQDGRFVITGYMPTIFSKREVYSPTTRTFSVFSSTEYLTFAYPIIFETSDGQNAIGVICPDLFPTWPQYPAVSFGTPSYVGFDYSIPKWSVIFKRAGSVPPDQYVFHVYLAVGTADSVRATVDALYQQFNP